MKALIDDKRKYVSVLFLCLVRETFTRLLRVSSRESWPWTWRRRTLGRWSSGPWGERERERVGKVYQGRKSMLVQIREAQQNYVFVRQNGSKMWPDVVLFHHEHFFKRSSDLWLEITVDSTLWVSECPQTTRRSEIKVMRAIRSHIDESRDVQMDLKSWSLLFSPALAFFCSSSCEGSNNRLYLVCSVWPIFTLHFSQMLSEHHLVCKAEIGGCGGAGGSNRESHLMNGERALMLLKGRRATPPPPPLRLYGDMVMTVTFSVTNVCDYLLGGRKCVLNKGQCDSWRSRFHFQTASKNKEYKPAPHIDLFSFLILGDLHLNLTQMLVVLFQRMYFVDNVCFFLKKKTTKLCKGSLFCFWMQLFVCKPKILPLYFWVFSALWCTTTRFLFRLHPLSANGNVWRNRW